MTEITAQHFVDLYPDRIIPQLNSFDYLKKFQPDKVSQNPGGFLRASIEKNYNPPIGYVSPQEQKQQERYAAVCLAGLRPGKRPLPKGGLPLGRQGADLWLDHTGSGRPVLRRRPAPKPGKRTPGTPGSTDRYKRLVQASGILDPIGRPSDG